LGEEEVDVGASPAARLESVQNGGISNDDHEEYEKRAGRLDTLRLLVVVSLFPAEFGANLGPDFGLSKTRQITKRAEWAPRDCVDTDRGTQMGAHTEAS